MDRQHITPTHHAPNIVTGKEQKIYRNRMTGQKIYKYYWKNNPKRKTMKNRLCRVTARMKMNSIAIEFLDNEQQEITSRNSVRGITRSNVITVSFSWL